MSVNERISWAYPSMTKNERKIADYCNSYPSDFKKLSVQELGEKTNTSPAAIIRFAKKLNYAKLSELRFDILDDQNTSIKEIVFPVSDTDGPKQISSNISKMIISEIEACVACINYDKLEKIAPILQKANKIFLFGIGSSGLIAGDLAEKLTRINKNVVFSIDAHMQLMHSLNMSKKDIAIFFTASGQTKEIINYIKQAKKNNTFSIVITRDNNSKVAKMANFCISIPEICTTQPKMFTGTIVYNPVMMFVASILYVIIAKDNFTQNKQRLIFTRDAINKISKDQNNKEKTIL